MIMSNRFFKLTIHRQSYDKYYMCAEQNKEKMISIMESDWGKPYDEILKDIRLNSEASCWWPPWDFNGIVGFVDVGKDLGFRLTGNVLIQRRYFHKDSQEYRECKRGSRMKKAQILYFRELGPENVDCSNNSSIIAGIDSILSQAETIIRDLCKTKKYKWVLQRLPFPLECINFVKVLSKLNPEFMGDAK